MKRDLKYWNRRIEDLRLIVECETVRPSIKEIYKRTLCLAQIKARELKIELFHFRT